MTAKCLVCFLPHLAESKKNHLEIKLIPLLFSLMNDRSEDVKRETVGITSLLCTSSTTSPRLRIVSFKVMLASLADQMEKESQVYILRCISKAVDPVSKTPDTLDSNVYANLYKQHTDIDRFPGQAVDSKILCGARCAITHCIPLLIRSSLDDISDWKKERHVFGLNVIYGIALIRHKAMSSHVKDILIGLSHSSRSGDDAVETKRRLVSSLLPMSIPFDELVTAFTEILKRKSQAADGVLSIKANVSGCFLILSETTKYIRPEVLFCNVDRLVDAICNSSILESASAEIEAQVIETIYSLLAVCKTCIFVDERIGKQLFLTVCKVLSNHGSGTVHDRCYDVLDTLRLAFKMPDLPTLFHCYFDIIFKHISLTKLDGKVGYVILESNGKYSCQSLNFLENLLIGCDTLVCGHMDEIFPFLSLLLEIHINPDVRIRALALMDTLLRIKETHEFMKSKIDKILSTTLLPNCEWRVGRVASAVRKIGLKCLEAVVNFKMIDFDAFDTSCVPEILICAKSALSDEDCVTRKLACSILYCTFRDSKRFDNRLANTLYPDLIKMLDDSNDMIRVKICQILVVFVDAVDRDFWAGTSLNVVVDALFIHLDDQNIDVQHAVLKVLKKFYSFNSDKVAKKAEAHSMNFRNSKILQVLINK
jgi:dynein assembly factor 5